VPFFGTSWVPKGKETMAEVERESQNNPLDDVAAAASDRLHGKTISFVGSATGQIDAGQVKMQASSAGRIQAHAVHMENAAAGMVSAGSLETHDSLLGMTVAREAHLTDSLTPLVVASRVEAKEVRTVLLVAGKVQGNVQTVFTLWSALAAGFGLGAALIGLGTIFSRRAPATKAASRRKNV
jgi:hypothetical protein